MELAENMTMKKLLITALMLSAVALLGACSNAGDDPGDDINTQKFPIELTSARIEAGENVYAQNCAQCHGPVQGPAAIPAAPVHSDAGHTWHHPDRLLYEWVMDRPPLATIMPAFRGTLSEQEVLEVLSYIKSSWSPEVRERQDEGSAQYEAQVIEYGSD